MVVCEVHKPENCILITKCIVKLKVNVHKLLYFVREEQYRSSQCFGPPGVYRVPRPSHTEHQFLSCRPISSTPNTSKYFVHICCIIFLTSLGISPWKILRLYQLFRSFDMSSIPQ
jgi:hypothetical protein